MDAGKTGFVDGDALVEVVGVGEGSDGGGLDEGVDVEWFAGAVGGVNDFGAGGHIAEA